MLLLSSWGYRHGTQVYAWGSWTTSTLRLVFVHGTPSLWMSFQDDFNIVVNTHTCDLSLWTSFFGYFIVVANSCIWDPGSLDYFNIVINTYTWDPSLWLYILLQALREILFEGGWNVGILPKGLIGGRGGVNGPLK
jgi:hypothetical protein